jgi:hypothetical protein
MSQQSNPQSQKPYNNPAAHGNPEKPGMQFRPDQNNADPKDPKNAPPEARNRHEPEDDDKAARR